MQLISTLVLFALFITASCGKPKKPFCPKECRCKTPEDSKLLVLCTNGGLKDNGLRSLLSRMPKQASVIKIIGPKSNPNNFSISLDFLRFKNLQELHLINCGLPSLGKRVFGSLKTLTVLKVPHNDISYLSIETFENTGHLEQLDLAWNRLNFGQLPTGAFSHLKALKLLSLENNKIQNFPQNLLLGLKNLEILILGGNRLLPKYIAYLLADVANVTKLNINNCGLEMVPDGSFERVPYLRDLELAYNNLKMVPTQAFLPLKSLYSLNLAGNNLTVIPPFAFVQDSLKRLSLSHNRLGSNFFYKVAPNTTTYAEGIHPMAFADTGLVELDLSYNDYSMFHASLLGDGSKSLRSLSLAGNPFTKPIEGFETNTTLKELNLADSSIFELPSRLPDYYSKLSVLNLSGNPLHAIPASIVSQLNENLTVLDLSRCQFRRLPKSVKSLFGRVSKIYLHSNPWDCRCHILPLKNYYLQPAQTSNCEELRLDELRCASPKELKDALLVKLGRPSDCPLLFDAVSGLSQQSEIGILVAAVLAVSLLLALAVLVAIWTRSWGKSGAYRTREDSKDAMSSTNTEDFSGGPSERLF